MRMLLGQILVNDGLLKEEELNQALEKQKDDGRLLGIILIEMGFISQKELEKAIVKQKQEIINQSKADMAELANLQSL